MTEWKRLVTTVSSAPSLLHPGSFCLHMEKWKDNKVQTSVMNKSAQRLSRAVEKPAHALAALHQAGRQGFGVRQGAAWVWRSQEAS